jgi:hypothetical protein
VEDIPNESIYLDSVNIVQLLQCLLDLLLVRTDIADKNQSVIFLDLFHRTFGVQRMNDDFVLIQTRFAGN